MPAPRQDSTDAPPQPGGMPGIGAVLSERYRLVAVLGRGGMGIVYRGTDCALERTVAVKVLLAAGEPDTRRFVSEIRAMASLNHPGVVQLFDAGTDGGVPYLVMELVEGHALPDQIADGPLHPRRARRAGGELAAALAHAHAHGVVHRDVKPGNVLCGQDGRTRLTDFGIARLADATRITQPGMTTGSAAYLAPEQVKGHDVGPAADVYALGLVLLEALTARREYPGPPAEAASARLHRNPVVPADLPAPWPALLAAMTASDPADRPTAARVAEVLDVGGAAPASPQAAALAENGGTVTAPLPPGPRRPGGRRRTVIAAAAAVAVAAALLALSLRAPEQDAAPGAAEQAPVEGTAPPPELDDALQRLDDAVRP